MNSSSFTNCHLFTDSTLTSDDVYRSLEELKTYIDESHLHRNLMRCKKCGQLYFHEFAEEIDWVGGNDPQESIYAPVIDEAEGDRLNEMSTSGLMSRPHFTIIFPADEEKLGRPKWST